MANLRPSPSCAGPKNSRSTSFRSNPRPDERWTSARNFDKISSFSEIFETLQICLGSLYVNDLNLFGRAYQVTAQADSKFRLRPDDIGELKIRNANGEMVPLCTLVQLQAVTGPDKVVRYNIQPRSTARYGVTCVRARPRASHRCHSVPKRSENAWVQNA